MVVLETLSLTTGCGEIGKNPHKDGVVLDEFRLYAKVLTDKEVNDLYAGKVIEADKTGKL